MTNVFTSTMAAADANLASELTQQDVAKKIKSSRSRIAKIESASEDVSLDLLARYLFAVGGSFAELDEATSESTEESAETGPAVKTAARGATRMPRRRT